MSFRIELEKESFDGSDFLGNAVWVQSGIRVFANNTCLMGSPEKFHISDYFPGFARKAAEAAEQLSQNEDCEISFNATVCDLVFTHAMDHHVCVIAKDADGKSRAEAVSDPGIRVEVQAVIEELIDTSTQIYCQYNSLEAIPSEPEIEGLGDAIESAKRAARSNGYL